MAFTMDFTKTNETNARLQGFLQSNFLNKVANQRDTEQILLQDKLARERSTQQFQQAKDLEDFRSGLTIKEARTSAMLRMAQNPRFTSLMQVTNMEGIPGVGSDPGVAAQIQKAKQELATWLEPLSQIVYGASHGTIDPKLLPKAFMASDLESVLKIVEESGRNARATMTESGQGAGLEWQKEKAGIDRWATTVDNAMAHLRTEGVEQPTNEMTAAIRAAFAQGGRFPDPLNPQNRGYALEQLSSIRNQINSGRLPDQGQQSFISAVYNTWRIQGNQGAAAPAGAKGGATPVRAGETPAPIVSSGQRVPGGMPSPRTGLNAGEVGGAESVVKQNFISTYRERFLRKVYPEYYDENAVVDPQERATMERMAEQAATEYWDSLQKKK
jgi:hypothetical protein